MLDSSKPPIVPAKKVYKRAVVVTSTAAMYGVGDTAALGPLAADASQASAPQGTTSTTVPSAPQHAGKRGYPSVRTRQGRLVPAGDGLGAAQRAGEADTVRELLRCARLAGVPFKVHKVAAGTRHSAFLTTEGKLFMVGDGRYGQLGIGPRGTAPAYAATPRELAPPQRTNALPGQLARVAYASQATVWFDVSAGDRFTVALAGPACLAAHGHREGVLREMANTMPEAGEYAPDAAAGEPEVDAQSAGSAGSHAGSDASGSSAARTRRAKVRTARRAANKLRWTLGVDASAADLHLLAGAARGVAGAENAPRSAFQYPLAGSLNADDIGLITVWGWGDAGEGRIGSGSPYDAWQPTALAKVNSLRTQITHGMPSDIACGPKHTLLRTHRGRVLSWGNGRSGCLGHGTDAHEYEPRVLSSPLCQVGASAVAAGAQHSMALDAAGRLWVWGSGARGALGIAPLGHRWEALTRGDAKAYAQVNNGAIAGDALAGTALGGAVGGAGASTGGHGASANAGSTDSLSAAAQEGLRLANTISGNNALTLQSSTSVLAAAAAATPAAPSPQPRMRRLSALQAQMESADHLASTGASSNARRAPPLAVHFEPALRASSSLMARGARSPASPAESSDDSPSMVKRYARRGYGAAAPSVRRFSAMQVGSRNPNAERLARAGLRRGYASGKAKSSQLPTPIVTPATTPGSGQLSGASSPRKRVTRGGALFMPAEDTGGVALSDWSLENVAAPRDFTCSRDLLRPVLWRPPSRRHPLAHPSRSLVSIAAGGSISAGIDSQGVLWVWGNNAGQVMPEIQEPQISVPHAWSPPAPDTPSIQLVGGDPQATYQPEDSRVTAVQLSAAAMAVAVAHAVPAAPAPGQSDELPGSVASVSATQLGTSAIQLPSQASSASVALDAVGLDARSQLASSASRADTASEAALSPPRIVLDLCEPVPPATPDGQLYVPLAHRLVWTKRQENKPEAAQARAALQSDMDVSQQSVPMSEGDVVPSYKAYYASLLQSVAETVRPPAKESARPETPPQVRQFRAMEVQRLFTGHMYKPKTSDAATSSHHEDMRLEVQREYREELVRLLRLHAMGVLDGGSSSRLRKPLGRGIAQDAGLDMRLLDRALQSTLQGGGPGSDRTAHGLAAAALTRARDACDEERAEQDQHMQAYMEDIAVQHWRQGTHPHVLRNAAQHFGRSSAGRALAAARAEWREARATELGHVTGSVRADVRAPWRPNKASLVSISADTQATTSRLQHKMAILEERGELHVPHSMRSHSKGQSTRPGSGAVVDEEAEESMLMPPGGRSQPKRAAGHVNTTEHAEEGGERGELDAHVASAAHAWRPVELRSPLADAPGFQMAQHLSQSNEWEQPRVIGQASSFAPPVGGTEALQRKLVLRAHKDAPAAVRASAIGSALVGAGDAERAARLAQSVSNTSLSSILVDRDLPRNSEAPGIGTGALPEADQTMAQYDAHTLAAAEQAVVARQAARRARVARLLQLAAPTA